MHRVCLPALLVLAALAAARPAAAQAADSSGPVWCLDRARALVTRGRAGACRGEVIDEAEARRVRAARVRAVQSRLRAAPPVIPGKKLSGVGSGFFVSAAGHVVTNNHVVAGCDAVSVTPAGAGAERAEIVALDPADDLALLQVPARPRAFARFREPFHPRPGAAVAAVGYPLRGLVAIRPIMVAGRIGGAGDPRAPGRFPIDIDIRRGNSGSPVLDPTGRVVGVVSSKIDTPGLFAATGRVVRDVGFAIAAPTVLALLRGHGVAVRTGSGGVALTASALFARARGFVAQIGCWR